MVLLAGTAMTPVGGFGGVGGPCGGAQAGPLLRTNRAATPAIPSPNLLEKRDLPSDLAMVPSPIDGPDDRLRPPVPLPWRTACFKYEPGERASLSPM